MRRTFLHRATCLLAVLALFGSCRYKDLCYDHNHSTAHNFFLKLTLNLDIDIDVEVENVDFTKIKVPELMVVCFYDTLTGAVRNRSYVGPYGGDLHVDPGVYNMVVYAFDTEWTWVRGEAHIDSLEAYTSDITDIKSPLFLQAAQKDSSQVAPGPIIYTPDHLLVTRKRVEIPPYSLEKQEITIEATASTIVESYRFRVKNISGVEHVASVDAFISNQARASFFGRGELSKEPATIYFPMEVDRRGKMFKCSFNTFGKLPGESKSYLNVVITDTQGKPHTLVTDITEQFEDTTHTIVIEDSVIIPPPASSGGGIAPTVEDWEEEVHDVGIG